MSLGLAFVAAVVGFIINVFVTVQPRYRPMTDKRAKQLLKEWGVLK